MAIVRWNPWNLSSLLNDDLDLPTFPGVSRMLGQGLNIYETENEIVAEVALPGISEDRIDVSIDEGIVRISASTEEKKEEKDRRKYFMSSMSSNYNYSFRLPDGAVTADEPQAVLQHGVLKLSFKKPVKAEPKKIKVVAQGKNSSSVKTNIKEDGE